jgi:hypothetical protein
VAPRAFALPGPETAWYAVGCLGVGRGLRVGRLVPGALGGVRRDTGRV